MLFGLAVLIIWVPNNPPITLCRNGAGPLGLGTRHQECLILRKFALPLLAVLASCTSMTGPSPTALADRATPMISPILTTADAHDPFTYAEPEVARVTHVALDLALDFKAKRVSGSATLDILAAPGADHVILDSDGLDIASITDASGKKLAFNVGAEQAGKGAPVRITIPASNVSITRKIVVAYTSPPMPRRCNG